MTILILSYSQLVAQITIPHEFIPSGIDIIPGTNTNEPLVLGNDCFRFTTEADVNDQWVGSGVWDLNQLDLNNNNNITINFNLGDNDDDGGDGITLVLQDQGTSGVIGAGGGFLGIPGANSIAVEVDVFDNGMFSEFRDIPQDHVALVVNGDQSQPYRGPIRALPGGENLEDGNNHRLTIFWTPICEDLQRIAVFVDGHWRFSIEKDFINTVFGGNTMVNWGITGTKATTTNNQVVCVQQIDVTTARANFHFEDELGIDKDEFICGEDVYIDGTASSNYDRYRIQVRCRDIDSPPDTPYDWVGSMGDFYDNIGVKNLSELVRTELNGTTFEADKEYQITLVLRSSSCNWDTRVQNFTMIDGGIYNPHFEYSPSGNSETGEAQVFAVSVDQIPNTIVVGHQWRIYYAGPDGETNISNPQQVPGTPTISTSTASFQGLQINTWYFIRHGIWNECIEWQEKRRAFNVRVLAANHPANESGRPRFYVQYGPAQSDGRGNYGGYTNTNTDDNYHGRNQFFDGIAINNTKEKSKLNLSISPNPIQQNQELLIKSDSEISQVEVFDINGKIVNSNSFSRTDYQVSFAFNKQIQSGIYFVKVYLNNNQIDIKKLIVH